jgi:hypothetical protein
MGNFGFLFGKGGPHAARTMMFDDLSVVLDRVDCDNATSTAFKHVIIEDNCLSKKSGKTRLLTHRHLTELYGLDNSVPIFRVMLSLWRKEEEGRELLAVLCALSRDALLRKSYEWIRGTDFGNVLSRKTIGKATLKGESATVSAPQRIQIRKVMHKLGLANIKQGEELAKVPEFLQQLSELANNAGGDAPRPFRPNTKAFEAIRLLQGDEQLLSIYNQREALSEAIDAWQATEKKIALRLPLWRNLEILLKHAAHLEDVEPLHAQAHLIKEQHHLLRHPGPSLRSPRKSHIYCAIPLSKFLI